MPNKSQIRAQQRAIKKLRDVGLYSGKTDLRKAPTSYQKSLIRKYAAVVSGKAEAVKPSYPKSFEGLFERKGKVVIVPKREGERVRIDKSTGEIVTTRKVGSKTVKARFVREKPGKVRKVERGLKPVQYALPFNRGKGRIEWKRFPTMGELRKFAAEYKYKRVTKYVVEEEVDSTDQQLTTSLKKRLRAPKSARWRFV